MARRRSHWSDWVAPDPAHNAAPELTPIFGAQVGWSPDRTCADVHPNGPIPSGSACVCMACHKSGQEARVARHTKPGDGQLRDGWEVAQPTVYVPATATTPRGGAKRLRGGIGR